MVICQWTLDWDGLLSCASFITVLLAHVGHQAYHVVLFLLEFVGVDRLEAWCAHRASFANFCA